MSFNIQNSTLRLAAHGLKESNMMFTELDKQVLTEQLISDTSPGTIVKDFNVLLDYVKTHEIEATKSNFHLAMKHLTPINALLSNPEKISVDRPQQKHFPNIGGLFLLL
jgi:hypothetical protein